MRSRPLAILVVALLVLSACSSGGSEQADGGPSTTAITTTTGTSDPATGATDPVDGAPALGPALPCDEDVLGFTDDQCADIDEAPPASVGDGPVEVDPDWLGGRNSRAASALLARGLLDPCGTTPISNANVIADAPLEVRRTLEQVNTSLRRLRRTCSEPVETFDEALADAVRQTTTFIDQTVDKAPTLGLDGLAGDERLAEVILTYEWAAWALAGGTRINSHSNALWTSHVHRGHVQTLALGTDPTRAVVGGTQSLYAINPAALGDATVNLSLPVGPPTSIISFLSDTLGTHAPAVTEVVVGVSISDLLAPPDGDCPSSGADRLQSTFDQAARLFDGAPGIDVSLAGLLDQPEIADRLALAPLAPAYARAFGAAGALVRYPDLTEEFVGPRNERRVSAFAQWDLCDAELRALAALGSVASVETTTFAIMPIHSELRNAAGDEAFEALLDELAEVAGDNVVIDLSGAVPDEEFLDFTLTTEAGAARVSELLAAEL